MTIENTKKGEKEKEKGGKRGEKGGGVRKCQLNPIKPTGPKQTPEKSHRVKARIYI